MTMRTYLVGISVYNEGLKIRRVVEKFNQYDLYDVLIVDDGSSDGAVSDMAREFPVTVLRNDVRRGAGFTTRQTIRYAQRQGYPFIIFVSGNDKDDPADVPKFVRALGEGFDFVQGSRFLPGGRFGSMPFYRQIATRFIHPVLFSWMTSRRFTDTTNGFRAIRTRMTEDPRMDIDQPWLDEYELEPYLFYYAVRLGYRVTEVPVTKIYPPKREGYTKMKPFGGWWSILRPIFYLGLRLRQ